MSSEQDRSVVTPAAELLARMSVTMKTGIAPNTTGTAKPQAYMAAVVLEKIAKQLELAPDHAAQAQRDATALRSDLAARTSSVALPGATQAAITALAADWDAVALCNLVRALYADRAALGDDLFASLLGRVRLALRADIDRRMEYSA